MSALSVNAYLNASGVLTHDVVVSGTLTPNVAGNYHLEGVYNGYPYFHCAGVGYIYYQLVPERCWVVSPDLGSYPTGCWYINVHTPLPPSTNAWLLWNGSSGTLTTVGLWTDLSQDVLQTEGLSITWGMDGGRPDDNCASPGTCTFTLSNAANTGGRLQGRYSPGHANCTAGFGLNTPIRVVVGTESGYRVLGPYRIASITPTPGQYGPQTVAVLATDWLEEAAEAPVIYDGAVDVDGSAVITSLLVHMDAQPTATSLDTGATRFNYPVADLRGADDRVLAAFKGLAQSEGGFIYLTGAGTLTFEARSRRAADTTDDFTLNNTMHGLEAGRSRADLVNALRLTVHPPEVSSARVVLASLAAPFLLAAGATAYVTLDYRDPDTLQPCGGISVSPPDAYYGDYAANTRADGLGTDKTAQLTVSWPFGGYPGAASMTYLLLNGGADDFYVTTLQVRGYAVIDRDPITVSTSDATSIAAYGRRTLDMDLPYQGDPNVAQGLADYWRTLYADADTRATSLSCVIVSDAALQALLLGVDVGSRVALVEPLTALDRSYWVQGIALTLRAGPVADLTLRLAPASQTLYWLLGTSGRSELGSTTVLGFA